MGDKNLSESEWKKFARGRDFKDAGLLKALASLEKARTPALEVEALAELEKQADALRKAHKADKELGAYLDELDRALVRQRKLSEADARKAAAESREADEEEETPALLTTRLTPLLRQVRKGEEMQVLLASSGQAVAVLMSRRAISPSRRKLLADYLDGGTPKFFAGTCLFEEKAFTFVLKTQAAGLARKVKAALLKQTELRLKVRVRGEDGEQDDDGEEAEDLPEAGDDPGDAAGAAPAPAAAAWVGRLAELQAGYDQALRAGHPEAGKLRALMAFASEKAGEKHDYPAAIKALDMLDKLLQAAPPATAAGPAGAAGKVAPAVVYTQTRLAWIATRSKVQKELDKLEAAILEAHRDHAVLPEVRQKVRKLDEVLAMFDESLADVLDNALNATDATQKQGFHTEAREVISRYQGFLASDPFLQELDGNPFVPVAVKATLAASLATLSSKIV